MFANKGAIATAIILMASVSCRGDSKPRGPVSTRAGVYTVAQAARGKDLYLSLCSSCHNVASHSGVTFATLWSGHRLSELYEYIGVKMPKNSPGTLSEQQTADIVAYILKLNAMPSGSKELPADSAALDKIRFGPVNQGS